MYVYLDGRTTWEEFLDLFSGVKYVEIAGIEVKGQNVIVRLEVRQDGEDLS